MGRDPNLRQTRAGARRTALVLLACVAALTALPRPVPAQTPTWVLEETLVNPNNEPTEFVVGVTPNYYESPRFDGSFERYSLSPGNMSATSASVDRGYQYYNVTISFSIDPPPSSLTPGETVTLGAAGSASGSYADAANPFEQFEFFVEGARIEGNTQMAVGINPDLAPTSAAVSPSFIVPVPSSEDSDLKVIASLWNCAACQVVWIYRPQIPAPETTATTAAPSTTSPPSSTTVPDEPGQCYLRGLVTDGGNNPGTDSDPGGHPLPGVRISLLLPTAEEPIVTATDADGRYEMLVSEEALPPSFDAGADELVVSLILQEAAHDPPRFEVLHREIGTSLWSRPFKLGSDCPDGVIDFDFPLAAIPDDYDAIWPEERYWDDLGEIYHRIHNATALADLVRQPIDYGGPLLVCAFCTGAGSIGPNEAFWCGALSNGGTCSDDPAAPFIGLGARTSLLSDGGWPDNREYHEFGHHFLADSFGNAIPRFEGNLNHEGYYINPTSTDAWTEGFAEFYSMMVTKHVDRRVLPHFYRMAGKWWNLEIDYRAWSYYGLDEELAVAGLLLDLEDGPEDYQAGRNLPHLVVEWHDTFVDPALGTLVIGEVANYADTIDYSEQTMVAVEFRSGGRLVDTSWGITTPWDLRGGRRGFFAVISPAGLVWDEVAVVAFEGRPGDNMTDDDLIDLTLQEVWDTIVSFTSAEPESNGYLFDITDLHAAFRADFGGADADGNGMDDIDQLFIAHGYFADTNGDRSFNREQPGRSDHPGPGSLADMLPRRDFEPAPAAHMALDSGGVPAAIAVRIALPEPYVGHSWSYLADVGPDGRFLVTLPPENSGATVTLAALADGHDPVFLGEIDGDAYWEGVEDPDALGPVFTASFVPSVADSGGDGGGARLWLLLGGALLMAAAGVWAVLLRRGRRVDHG